MAKRDPALLLFLLTLTILFTAASSLSEEELDAALAALRDRGYSLFGNAVTASDVRLELLRVPNGSYTFFAPTDDALFALDMASPASFYVRSLRRHIVLRRLPIHLLGVLPSGYLLPTLLPKRSLCISRRLPDGYITADDVEVVLPGVFHGRDLVAHGLDGILPPRHPVDVYSRADPHPRSPDLADSPSRSTDSSNPPSRSADPPALWAPMVSPSPGIEFPAGSPLSPLYQSPPPSTTVTHGAPSPAVQREVQSPISVPVGLDSPSPAVEWEEWPPISAPVGMDSPSPAVEWEEWPPISAPVGMDSPSPAVEWEEWPPISAPFGMDSPSPAVEWGYQPPLSAPVEAGSPSPAPASMTSPAPPPPPIPTNPWLLGSPEFVY